MTDPSRKHHQRRRGGIAGHVPAKQPVIFGGIRTRSVLGTLPVAYGPDDISSVASQNRVLRERVNKEIGKTWRAMSKSEIKRAVLSSEKTFRSFLEANRRKRNDPYNVESDPEGHIQWLEEGRRIASQTPLALHLITEDLEGMRGVVEAILKHFKHLVEDKAVWKSLYGQNKKPLPELYAQKMFYVGADTYCKANNIDITPEANSGPGPVDFKFSKGYSTRVVVEVKLSGNSQLVSGYTKQLEKYKKAEQTDAGYYLVMDMGTNGAQVAKVHNLEASAIKAGENHSKVVLVDARRQQSASNL